MSLKDGKIGFYNVDKKLFESLKITFVPEFMDKDLGKYARHMAGYYLLRNEDDGSYEFDFIIMKKNCPCKRSTRKCPVCSGSFQK